jgi:purine-binding chemotaxis protein CheW
MSGATGGPAARGAEAARWEALARAAARSREEHADEVGGVRQLLVFELAGTPYALPVESVREIVRIRPIAGMPRVPSEVRGVISLRGEILQVIDLRRRLALPPVEPTRRSRIVVVRGDEAEGRGAAGMLVDAVREVLRVPQDAIRPSAHADPGAVESICVRGDRFVSLIDLNRVLAIR